MEIQEIQKLEDKKLEQLAANPDNIVYRYQDTEEPTVVLPLETVKRNIHELWEEFKELRGERLLTISDVRKIRTRLESTNAKWAAFSKSHPLIFDRVVDHRTGEPEIKALLHMIRLKHDQEAGKIKDGAEKLHSYIMKKFAVSEAQYRSQNPKANIINPTSNSEQKAENTKISGDKR